MKVSVGTKNPAKVRQKDLRLLPHSLNCFIRSQQVLYINIEKQFRGATQHLYEVYSFC